MSTWKTVPTEAVPEQVHAAFKEQPDSINAGYAQAYRTMIENAPPAPSANPFIWICLAPPAGSDDTDTDPRIRAWTASDDRARELTALGHNMIPLFAIQPTRDEAFAAYRRTMSRIVTDLQERLDKVKEETAKAMRDTAGPAKIAALDAALETLQSLRHVTATDFKSENCLGQRGADRCDAFFDAYTAVHKLKGIAAEIRPDSSADIEALADGIVREMHSVLNTQWDRDCLRAKALTALRTAAQPQAVAVTEAMVEAGAIGLMQDVAEHDFGPAFSEASEQSKAEAKVMARAVLNAALSLTRPDRA